MRENGPATASTESFAYKVSKFWSKPTIGDVHNNEDSTPKVVFNERNELIQNTPIRPNATFSFIADPTRHQAAMFSLYAYGDVKVDERSNDFLDLRIPQRLGENPDAFTQSETYKLQYLTMPRLRGAKQDNDGMTYDLDKARSILPDNITYTKRPAMGGIPAMVICTLPSGESVPLSEAVQRHQAGTLVA